MGIGLPLVGAVLFTALAIGFSWAHAQKVRATPSPALGAVLQELRRAPRSERVDLAVRRTDADTWEGRLARAIAEAIGGLEVDAASEAVGDLAILYGSRERWGPAALRIQLLGAVLMAALAVVGGDLIQAGAALGLCLVGALTVHTLSSRAKVDERRQRERADTFVQLLVGDAHGAGSSTLPTAGSNAARTRASRRR